jgi:hypothetical protein
MKKITVAVIFLLTPVLIAPGQVVTSARDSVFISNIPHFKAIKSVSQTLSSDNLPAKPYTDAEYAIGGGTYYALLIGISNYNDPQISDLSYPTKDAETFFKALTSRYTFEGKNIKLLRNATMAEIIEALDYFAKIVRPVDNFLIFYAGHGIWDFSAEVGFWLPADASKNSKLDWFRNSTLRDYLREIKARHTLLITDACFSGSIFKSRSPFMDAPVAIKNLYALPSRKAMTSGTLTEVPDQSVFLRYMKERLIENKEKYLSSEQLFSSLRLAVINNSNVIFILK